MSASDEEPLNLLSFDGGGVRGVSSLVILHEIMIKIQKQYGLADIPKPCDIFHMIAGTSTGGLIAIMLGRLRMSTEEALREYDTCAAKIFSKRKKTNVLERFQSTPLQETIEDLVKRRDMGELMRDPTNPPKGKVVVCVLPAKQALGDARRVRSYKSKENWDKDIKIWEAARATTAASSYFKPQSLTSGPETEDYIDAALGNNNPINHLISEACEQFGLGRRLGCLVSIGTGTRKGEVIRAKSGLTNLFHLKRAGSSLIDALKNKATDAEAAHVELEKKFFKSPGVYFRFNVDDAAAKVKLNEYNKMEVLKVLTSQYMSRTDVEQQLLLAAQVLETASAKDGLTLGHLQLDPTQIIKAGQKAQLMGEASQFFTGRNDILRTLNSFFSERPAGPFSRRQFCLYGIGGLGKTQIALKAANIFRTNVSDPWAAEGSPPRKPRFKHILYIDGTDSVTISQSYANIARDQFDMADGDSDGLMVRVLQKLAGLTDDWFLIYDNCNQADRRGLIPVGDTGNILFTTRNRLIRDQMRPECVYDVPLLDELEASWFLLTASGPQYSGLNTLDMDYAQEIVTELGCLPLAIDQAAAYIRAGECHLHEYLQVFREKKVQLLKEPKFKGSLPQNQAVYTTFEASYTAIVAMKRREGMSWSGISADFALRALDLLCFWHNEGMPVTVTERAAEQWAQEHHAYYGLSSVSEDDLKELTSCSAMTWEEFFFEEEGELPRPVRFVDGLQILERYSIVEFSPNRTSVSMHVLLHSWARDRMTAERRSRQSLVSKAILLQSFELWASNCVQHQHRRRAYVHIRACLNYSTWGSGLISETFELELMVKLSYILAVEKKFGESEEYFAQAMHLGKLAHGTESSFVQRLLLQSAKIYREMGRLGIAEAHLLEAIDRLQTEDEFKSLEYEARSRTRLGELKRKKRSRKNRRNTGSSEDVVAARGEELTPGMLTAIARSFGPKAGTSADRSLQLADLEEELSMTYYDQGNMENCQIYLEKAHERRKKILHPDSISMWRSTDEIQRKIQLIDPYYWHGRFKSAKEHFVDEEEYLYLLSDYRVRLSKSLGDSILRFRQRNNHPSYDLLYETAHELYEKSEGTHQEMYGDNDRRTLELMRWKSKCLVGMGRGEEAEALARKCLASSIMGYGECHQETILCLEQLYHAIVSRLGGPDLEACYVIKDAWLRADAILGEDHRYTRRMLKLTIKAVDGIRAELSKWLPLGQDAMDDPHWLYKGSEDTAMRVELLGSACNVHEISYTISDPTFNRLVLSAHQDRLKRLEKGLGTPMSNLNEPEAAVARPDREFGYGLNGPAQVPSIEGAQAHPPSKYLGLRSKYQQDPKPDNLISSKE
ncbi:putative calcium-independent phospholipase A2-gamma [Cladorrhinum sp. PSN259]|nr:putative calcium-independent phospholipase A2-gamma [Cladorrhinum sp. PSN259]